jgi:hypothetical protein
MTDTLLEDQFASLTKFTAKDVANEGCERGVNAVCFQNVCPQVFTGFTAVERK